MTGEERQDHIRAGKGTVRGKSEDNDKGEVIFQKNISSDSRVIL